MDKVANGPDERVGHGYGVFSGGKTVAEIAVEETGDTGLGGELGDVSVEIHAVDALQFHDDVGSSELPDFSD